MPYNLNNHPVSLSEEPVERGGKNYVPLAEVVHALGGNVNWDVGNRVAQSTIGQWTATIRTADENVDVNGQQVHLSAPPYVEDSRMYVPWDFFRDAYGYKASMEGSTLSVHL